MIEVLENGDRKVTATLLVTCSTILTDDEDGEETVRYCVEQDLQDIGYEVDSVEVYDNKF